MVTWCENCLKYAFNKRIFLALANEDFDYYPEAWLWWLQMEGNSKTNTTYSVVLAWHTTWNNIQWTEFQLPYLWKLINFYFSERRRSKQERDDAIWWRSNTFQKAACVVNQSDNHNIIMILSIWKINLSDFFQLNGQ